MKLTKSQSKIALQFLKYMVGGGAYFWSGYLVFSIGYSVIGLNWILAKMIADVVGMTINYFIQRYWAFRSPELNIHPAEVTGKYIALTVLNLAIDYSIVASLKHIGITPYAGLFISAGFFTVWNYIWYRFFVFEAKSK